MFYFVWLFKIFTFLFATVDVANDQKHVMYFTMKITYKKQSLPVLIQFAEH